ncbi:hypothetical protein B0T10DRAFT_493744 [Thelonectria olida]|uniref:Thioredoxin-like fold domain-containing protein n=1 Tax=Thelonectria olida TaxID=1576542 RepID=A0A9P8VXC6_9HYPO|nr:hypothetical protein B0T10DRAFT_493744 [Thelonectria olida]
MTPKLTVYRGFAVGNHYVWSPFVSKLEARLRFGGVPYSLAQGNPKSAPRGKIPYVDVVSDGGPSEQMGDTTLIIRSFIDNGVLTDLNAGLTPTLKAQDLAVRALLEDKVYFYQNRERWCDNYETMRNGALGAIPYPIRLLVGLLAYRSMVTTLHGQGTGRYTNEEITSFKQEAWESINALLAESRANAGRPTKPFWILGGPEPTEADSTVYGFVTSALACKAAPETTKIVRSFPVIMEYARRIHDQFFSEYELWEESDESEE